jgi:Zn-dependent M28 family amino/carboxypeptidase
MYPFKQSAIFIICIFICLSCNSGLQQNEAAQLINKDIIMKDVLILSADDMEGRAPGSEGEKKAAQYIAKRFQENGLQGVDGSYFQKFNLVGTKKNPQKSTLKITFKGKELSFISDSTLTYWSSSQKEIVDIIEAPLIFAGYGVQAPEHDWDDFKDVDVNGKVLLFLNNDPPVEENGVALFKGEARTYYGRWTYKFEQAMQKGAAGAIMIHTTPSASYPFSVIGNEGATEQFAIDLPNSGYQVDLLSWMDESMAEKLAKAMGTNLNGLFEMGKRRDFKPVDTGFKINAHIETDIRKIETQNVMGLIPGNDPVLKDEVLVYSAHYDHIGVVQSLEGDDKIYNGAWDNALGTSCIISIGKAFSSLTQKPARSVLFLATAAEESGSLGSKWFVSNPPFEKNRLIANFNIDMPQIFGITSDISAIGLNMNMLGDALREIIDQSYVLDSNGDSIALEVFGDQNPNAGSFYRSDQVNFAKAGIPALYFNPGKKFIAEPATDVRTYYQTHYHQVIDEVNEVWDLSGCERDMRLIFKTALKVANLPEKPRWNAGNEFEDEWKKLHGLNE